MRLDGTRGVWVWSVAGIGLALACSATDSSQKGSGGSSGSGASGGSSGVGGGVTGGSSGTIGTGGSGNIGVDAGNDSGVDPDAACQTVSAKASKPAVDIIWIVDNSCSMSDDIAKVRSNINTSFVPTISASIIDWRVIFISARGNSSQQVCVDPPLAGPNCADNPPKFHQLNCTVGSNDSLTIARNSYGAPGFVCAAGTIPWNTHLRFDATKVFVEVTDDEAGPPPFFLDALAFDGWAVGQAQPAGQFGTQAARKYIFHGIIGMDPNNPNAACTSATNTAVAPGLEYQKLAQVTGGTVRSICEDDWSNIFTTIAAGIVSKLSCEYAVPPPPNGGAIDPNKVNVSFTPGGGSPEDIYQDNNAGCDQGANGWQWDASKTKILLCGDACTKVKNDENGQIDIVFGCETKVVPPPS